MDESSYGTRRAINELQAIFACQWRNGMLPQIRFVAGQTGYRPDADDWGVPAEVAGPTRHRTSGITQPPIIGLCAEEVFRRIGPAAQAAHQAEFRAIAAGLEAFHAWLLRERDPAGEGLVLCLHPWETGTDNSPAFDPLIEQTRAFVEAQGLPVQSFGRADTQHVDPQHRPTAHDYYAYFGLLALFRSHAYDQAAIIAESPFLLQDVLFNSLFAASLGALARMQTALAELARRGDAERGRLREAAARNVETKERVAVALRRKLWHAEDGFYYSYDSRGGRQLTTPTVAGFLPLLDGLADTAQAERLLVHLTDPAAFWTPVPVPSTAPTAPAFNPRRYWSGPTWPVTNWLVIRGLADRGSPLAAVLRERTLAMVAEGAPPNRAQEAAAGIMAGASFGEEFTTPSRKQYAHAWLWDSAIVAVSWPLVPTPPPDPAPQPGDPGFWEYYDPYTGAPLGATPMTWTASLYLALLADV